MSTPLRTTPQRNPRCGAISTTGPQALVVVCSEPAGHGGPHRCTLPTAGARRIEWSR